MITVTANVVGRVTSSFILNYTVANTMDGTMTLKAFMDDESNVLEEGTIANGPGTLTVNAEENGIHVVFLVVTDVNGQAGSTSVTFTKVSGDEPVPEGLKLKYNNDVWDFATYPNRLYRQSDIVSGGEVLTTFEDATPYITEGDPVNASLLEAVSQNILGMVPVTVNISPGGVVTETSANGTIIIRRNTNGTTTVSMTDSRNYTINKDIIINSDGSVEEEVYV